MIASALLLVLTPFASANPCLAYDAPQTLGYVQNQSIDESSGLVMSRKRPGVWYTHNDSGDHPVIYAFDEDSSSLGEHEVLNASAVDWEDMAAGPCPGVPGSCLYVGDIGDNSQTRSTVTVYAVPEPTAGQDALALKTWTTWYPDGPRNAETLLVHPVTGAIYIVTKDSDGMSDVYRVPMGAAFQTEPMVHVAELEFDGASSSDRTATGGDWSRDGNSLVIRTYTELWEWTTDPADPEGHWGDDPAVWAAPGESQGEAVSYTPFGDLVTTSEGYPMPYSMLECVE